jgi:hypothetical protein
MHAEVQVPKRWPRSNFCELNIKLALASTGIRPSRVANGESHPGIQKKTTV